MKYRFLLFGFVFLMVFPVLSQNKYEQETRIQKGEFPAQSLELITPYLEGAKRLRFYVETDSLKRSFETKFKKGKLHYSIEFDEQGSLEDIEFIIQPNDVPEDSWNKITGMLTSRFGKVRIKKIQQQYPNGDKKPEKVLKDAFQNLILPYINYELIFSHKGSKGYQDYEGLFNADGNLIKLRKSLPANYDHLLY
nr:hypothetical protein [Allomuricauda sp.]